jgi:hypothetical protein
MDKIKKEVFTVISSSEEWSFLNGYSCYSIDKDNFIRHLSYKFGDFCIFHDIKDALERKDIAILTAEDFDETTVRHFFNISTPVQNVQMVAGYLSDYGYVLEFYLSGSLANDLKTNNYSVTFANEQEAMEWYYDWIS